LGTLADFRNGVNYNKSNFGTGIKMIGVSDFQDHVRASFDQLEEINPEGVVRKEHLLRDGDILFVRSNGNRELIGRSLFVSGLHEDVTHSAFSIRLRFVSPHCCPRFYAYLFRSTLIRQALSMYGGGTNISNLNQGILERLEVPLPAMPTQNRIASILSAYDDLIENNTRRIKILEEMAQMLYREGFVNFRFPGHQKVKTVESELGPIPEGWSAPPLEQVLEHVIGGGWGQDLRSDECSVPAYVIRGTDIPGARHGAVANCPLRWHRESNFRTRRLQAGDLVFEVSGGSKGQPVGRSLLVGQTLLSQWQGDVMCASFCKLLRPKSGLSAALYCFLVEAYTNGVIEKYQVQSTGISNFKFTAFANEVRIPLPPPTVMARFRELITPTLDAVAVFGKRNANLRTTRDFLLPKLISGEIPVEAAAELVEQTA
jgi:type I restriction enzyme S subunit